jgi:hypothetical protein
VDWIAQYSLDYNFERIEMVISRISVNQIHYPLMLTNFVLLNILGDSCIFKCITKPVLLIRYLIYSSMFLLEQ